MVACFFGSPSILLRVIKTTELEMSRYSWLHFVQSWTVRRHWLQAKTKCSWGLQRLRNRCASLAGLVLCFIACFILLVIAPLQTEK